MNENPLNFIEENVIEDIKNSRVVKDIKKGIHHMGHHWINAKPKIKAGLEKAGETIKSAAHKTGSAISSTASSVGNSIKSKYEKAKEDYKKKKGTPIEKAKIYGREAIEKTKQTYETTKRKYNETKKKFHELPDGKKVAYTAIPAAVLGAGAAAIYSWWKKKHKKSK